MIVEMAGRPPEHVKEILGQHVGQLDNVKDIEVFSTKVSEPKKLEAEQEFYTCFAEIELEVDNFLRLTELVFDFMPSSIEILEPGELRMGVQEATSFLNTLTGRLHRYDEIAKIAKMQNQQLAVKIQEFQEQGEKKEKKTGKKKKPKK